MKGLIATIVTILLAITIVFGVVWMDSFDKKIIIRDGKKTIEYNDTLYILVPATLEEKK